MDAGVLDGAMLDMTLCLVGIDMKFGDQSRSVCVVVE